MHIKIPQSESYRKETKASIKTVPTKYAKSRTKVADLIDQDVGGWEFLAILSPYF